MQNKENVKIFASIIDNVTIEQINTFKNHPAFIGEKIRIMCDTHAGKGSVIGFTSTYTDKIIPNVVGVDIGCGMSYIIVPKNLIPSLKEFDDFIKGGNVPSGFSTHKEPISQYESWLDNQLSKLSFELPEEQKLHIKKSLGTLGGGNHFIEINELDEKSYVLVIHSGSRSLGTKIADHHQKIADNNHKDNKFLMAFKTAYLEGEQAENYLNDMNIAIEYASRNREAIIKLICDKINCSDFFIEETIHNYVDYKDKMIRKGAISAKTGETVLIPFNMRDGSILAVGKGNEDWNCSAPHGAGRILSRTQAKEKVSLEEYKEAMKDVFTSCVSVDTLDESPFAYKDKDVIINEVFPTLNITHFIKPVYNFKASDKPFWRK